ITSPRFIIADEPTTALDSITQRQIVDLLTSLVDDAGASMLFITHDFSVLARATTRCYVLDAGRIVESGPTADLLASAACMDKHYTKVLLAAAGIPVAPGITLDARSFDKASEFKTDADAIMAQVSEAGLQYPLFVKPSRAGSSFGVTKVE
ncbi:hypothetical protein V5298_20865, partial [Alteromonas sp. 14N.309.X.WAT.G.H12]